MTTKPTPERSERERRLAEIRARVEKATEGPWTVALDSCAKCRDEGREGEYEILEVPSGYHAMLDRKEDAEFIAHARTDIPWLLKEIDSGLLAGREKGLDAIDAEQIAEEIYEETPRLHGNLRCWPGTAIIATKIRQHVAKLRSLADQKDAANG